MANYVKFMRGTTAAYNRLTTVDNDTLYFLSDNDGKEGSLYLGANLIAGPDVSGATSLGELTDILLTPGLDYDAILMYDSVELKWRDYSFDALTFRAATENLDGVAGFVPAPEFNERNKFLRGDGVWATAGTECQIFNNIKPSEGQSHANALALHTLDHILNKGDIAIIQDFIVDGKYQYTSYVYDGTEWCAMDASYDATNIYLKSALTTTNRNDETEILDTTGKNIHEALELVLNTIATSVIADAKTVVFNNNTLSLKDFGKRFYKYIPADESNPASYIIQEVNEDNPWKSGLEPKVVSENGVLVLGWYEPNPTTIDGINSSLEVLRTDVNNLKTVTSNLNSRLNDTYTKTETEAAIAAAAHLKRKKVDSIDDIDATADDADQYIYMVPTGAETDNKYYEYIVIDGIIEPVGTWEVDLSDYVTKKDAQTTQEEINVKITAINNELMRIDAKAEPNIITSVDDNFKITDKKLQLVAVSANIDLSQNESLIAAFVKKDANKDLVSNAEIEKLSTVAANAERNIINSIDETEFSITGAIERKLSVKKISGSKVNLQDNDDFVTVASGITTINTNLSTLSGEVNNITSQLSTINSNITNTNTRIDNVSTRLSAVEQSITWTDLI